MLDLMWLDFCEGAPPEHNAMAHKIIHIKLSWLQI
jgi:hypothetical protein